MHFEYKDIKELTAKNFGISINSLGESFVNDALDKYLKHLDEMKLKGIVDEKEEFLAGFFEYIKVPETWFFRQPESFEYLKRIVLEKTNVKKDKIRILSIPCSTGEEPYSIAIALESAGVSKDSYLIDAVDVSAVSVNRAKEAIYSKNSFREDFSTFDQEYFQKEGNFNRVKENIRTIPNFAVGNIHNPEFLSKAGKYDMIFCRNLLIYFTDLARQSAIDKIKLLLTDDGVVFTGYSEFVFFLQNGFKALEYKLSFACEIENQLTKTRYIEPKKKSTLPKPYVKRIIQTEAKKEEVAPKEEVIQQQVIADKSWELELLANAGDLEEAKVLAKRVLDSDTANSKELTISGAVFLACNMGTEAEICLERAIYLNPNEDDALIHLALIYEDCGKIEQAGLLKKRIRKINAKEVL